MKDVEYLTRYHDKYPLLTIRKKFLFLAKGISQIC